LTCRFRFRDRDRAVRCDAREHEGLSSEYARLNLNPSGR
jgi:hypothetical protein